MERKNFGWLVIFLVSSVLGFAVYADQDKPKDNSKKEVTNLPPFNAVSLSGVGNLYITQSNEQGFEVEAEATLLPAVVVYVKDKTLYIDLKSTSASNKSKLNYYLRIKDLQKIESFSNSVISIPDGLEGKVLNLSLNSFGEANLKIAVDKLIAKIDGGSKIDVKGSATEQEVQITGAGEFNGSKLVGQKAVFSIEGAGAAKAHVSDSLSAKISGEGEIKYCGKPTIIRDITGKGVVSPLDESEC